MPSSMNLRTNRTGQAENYVSLAWDNPSTATSPQFGGVKIQYVNVTAGDGKVYDLGTVFKPANTFQIVTPAPNTIQNWNVYIVSFDVNGNLDTIQSGVTPTLSFDVGTTGGTFDLSNAVPSTLAGGIGLVSGAIQLSGVANVGQAQAFTALYIKPTTSIVGFVGYDSASGYDGGWFQQIKGGGTGPANAPLYSDSSGNVFLNGALGGGNVTVTGTGATMTASGSGIVHAGGGATVSISGTGIAITNGTMTLNASGVTTTIENNSGVYGNGLSVVNNTSGRYSGIGDGGLAVADGAYKATVFAASPGAIMNLTDGSGNITGLDGGAYKLSIKGLQVVGTRKTGWTQSTGTALRSGWDTSTVTLTQLAETVKALLDDLGLATGAGHGLVGS